MVAAWFTKAINWYVVKDATRTKLFRIGIGLGFALCAFFYFGPVVFSLTGNEGHKADPNRRLIGSGRLGKRWLKQPLAGRVVPGAEIIPQSSPASTEPA